MQPGGPGASAASRANTAGATPKVRRCVGRFPADELENPPSGPAPTQGRARNHQLPHRRHDQDAGSPAGPSISRTCRNTPAATTKRNGRQGLPEGSKREQTSVQARVSGHRRHLRGADRPRPARTARHETFQAMRILENFRNNGISPTPTCSRFSYSRRCIWKHAQQFLIPADRRGVMVDKCRWVTKRHLLACRRPESRLSVGVWSGMLFVYSESTVSSRY